MKLIKLSNKSDLKAKRFHSKLAISMGAVAAGFGASEHDEDSNSDDMRVPTAAQTFEFEDNSTGRSFTTEGLA